VIAADGPSLLDHNDFTIFASVALVAMSRVAGG